MSITIRSMIPMTPSSLRVGVSLTTVQPLTTCLTRAMRSRVELDTGKKMCNPLTKRCGEWWKLDSSTSLLPGSSPHLNQNLTHNNQTHSLLQTLFCVAGQIITVCKTSYFVGTNDTCGKSGFLEFEWRVLEVSGVLLSARHFEAVW